LKERDSRDFLEDILRYMRYAENFVEGYSFEEFAEDEKTIIALVKCIEVVGEASKRIPEDVRSKYPTIPWRDMTGIRDRLVHGYFSVDMSIIWKTATEEFPEIKPQIEAILKDIDSRKGH
jgi:uncharacterized protein with HEPN domain